MTNILYGAWRIDRRGIILSAPFSTLSTVGQAYYVALLGQVARPLHDPLARAESLRHSVKWSPDEGQHYLQTVPLNDGTFVVFFTKAPDQNTAPREVLNTVTKALIDEENRTHSLAKNMQEKDEFWHLAAHQLQRPVGVLKSHIEPYSDQPDAKKKAVMHTSVDELQTLNQRLLSFVRLGENNADLRAEMILIGTWAQDIYAAWTKGNTTHQHGFFDETTEPAVAKIDEFYLRHSMNILLENAEKYAPEGAQIWGRVWADEVQVYIDIHDTGPGISEADQANIFAPFARGETDKSGSGMGLALARRIAQRHGGSLTVTSQIEHGSRFRLSLPRLQPELF